MYDSKWDVEGEEYSSTFPTVYVDKIYRGLLETKDTHLQQIPARRVALAGICCMNTKKVKLGEVFIIVPHEVS